MSQNKSSIIFPRNRSIDMPDIQHWYSRPSWGEKSEQAHNEDIRSAPRRNMRLGQRQLKPDRKQNDCIKKHN